MPTEYVAYVIIGRLTQVSTGGVAIPFILKLIISIDGHRKTSHRPFPFQGVCIALATLLDREHGQQEYPGIIKMLIHFLKLFSNTANGN